MSETVWVRTRSHGGSPRHVHTDGDCPALKRAAKTRRVQRDTLVDTPVCAVCQADGHPHGATTNDGPWTLLEACGPEDIPTGGER